MILLAVLLVVSLPAQAADGETSIPGWVVPAVFSVVVSVLGALIASVKSAQDEKFTALKTSQEERMRSLETNLKAAQADIHQIQVRLGEMATQAFVREMERDLGALLREQIGDLRAAFEALRQEIHRGRKPE